MMIHPLSPITKRRDCQVSLMKKPTHLRHPGQMGASTCLVHLLRAFVRDNANILERDRLSIASVLTVIAVCYENTPEDRLCVNIQYALLYSPRSRRLSCSQFPHRPMRRQRNDKSSAHAPPRRRPPLCSTTALNAVMIFDGI
jgi:hypothetical protein